MLPLMQSLDLLSKEVELKKCGFCVTPNQLSSMGVTTDRDPGGVLADESKWMMWLMTLLGSLTRNRIKHLLHYSLGPGLFAGLLSEKPATVKWVLGRLKALWLGYIKLQTLTAAAAQEAPKVCWMQQPSCQLLFKALADSNWISVPEEVMS